MSEEKKALCPLLPKMKSTYNVGNFTEGGAWKACERSEIHNLSEGLNLDNPDPRFFEVTSVPDMWARPLLFTMALYYDQHPIHKVVLGEWRGMLAMMALREYRKSIRLSVEEVQIPVDKIKNSDSSRDFLATLGRLAPAKTMADDTDWRQLYVIMFNNQPIGLTSPTTLVCTAPSYYGRITGVPWTDGSRLIDPVGHLNKNEKEALGAWLNTLRQNLTLHERRNTGFAEFDALLRLLDVYLQDLGGRPSVSVPFSQSSLGMNFGIYRYLDRPVEGRKGESNLALSPLSGIAAPTLIVAFREAAEQWNVPPHDVIVIGCATVADYPMVLDPLRQEYAGVILPEGMKLRAPEDFFTSKLVLIQKKPALPGAMLPESAKDMIVDGQPHSPLLPLNPEIMKYLNSEDLCRRLRFDVNNDRVLVHLHLTLSGMPGGRPRDVILTKEYQRSANEIQIISNVPILEVWPNFRTPTWKAYFSYMKMTQGKSFRAEPLVIEGEKRSRSLKNKDGKITTEINRTDFFPEVFVCQTELSEGGSLHQINAGILLVSKPLSVDQTEGSIEFGIDFGTTNTHVYSYTPGAVPRPVTLASRTIGITQSGSDRQFLYADFLPADSFPTPFLSFYHDHKRLETSKGVLVDGHIYFVASENVPIVDGLETDLKWSDEPRMRQFSELFLEQVCLQCSAEAVANNRSSINWHFSYPTAFSGYDLESFERIWSNITKGCLQSTGVQTGRPQKMAESVASARFFAEHPEILIRAPFNEGTVCIDIGGGTSDISVWQENRLIWQISLRFAGRDILFDYLYRDPSVLKLLGYQEKGSVFNFAAQNQRVRFNAALDTWLRSQAETDGSDKIFKELVQVSAKPEMKELIRFIAVGLSGLVFYIGQVLQSLAKNSQYQNVLPRVCVGGNGAKLFHWLAAGQFDKSVQAHRLFHVLLKEASGLSEELGLFEISISPRPKCEAAFGLVVEGKTLARPENVEENVLSGEDFTQDKNKRGWDSMISADSFRAGLKVDEKLPQLRRFIDTFNAHAPKLMKMQPISDSEIPVIRTQMSQYLSERITRKSEEIRVEPLFIAEIKFLLELLAARLREKQS